ncbi:helix-turn-helix domain-containing protein [Streptomyces sioyaensis]|uniref:Helix-turn-helix domain-containing protein n=1 Tax=Streptomyces sioyaensis TaxID=67364 RepID=A0A4Q1QK31_9ACTN|nr:helix-turn-helix domain-containing protein [Streptomyces sioyaensis]MBM4794127.1 helix-turn-helix domain-containing protein [Streptomyces sioyaensis]RXS60765.1 helix-turn-helix domain-containing protein [Streptomyces sioyaensis]
MLNETVFGSDELPVADRFDGWLERISRTHAPVHLSSPCADDYRFRQRVLELGEVRVWPATFDPAAFRRTPALIRRSDPEIYHVSLLLAGSATVSWGKRQAHYRPYDLHCNDSSLPHDVHTHGEMVTTVGLEIPKALVPLPETRSTFIGGPMDGRDGIGALLAQFLTRLAADTSVYRPGDGPRLGRALTALVVALFAHQADADHALSPENRRRNLRTQIRAFIRQNLHDPELTPRSIAAAHHISPSHLHRLFQDGDATVAAEIRRQRLEGARRDLTDPARHRTPVHAIAARWGYHRATDFSRAYRAAYGIAPKEHRRRAVAGRPGTALTPSPDAPATRPGA